MLSVAATVLLLTVAGGGGPRPEPGSVAWDGKATRLHSDSTTRIRFAVPAAGYLVTAHHFAQARSGQISDGLLVSVAGEQALLVDVLANPERLPLDRYFETHLGFLRDPSTAVTEGRAGKAKAHALLLDQPRTGQAFGQRLAVFALGSRIVKLSCPNRDDPALARLFERALESFEESAP